MLLERNWGFHKSGNQGFLLAEGFLYIIGVYICGPLIRGNLQKALEAFSGWYEGDRPGCSAVELRLRSIPRTLLARKAGDLFRRQQFLLPKL